MFYTPGEMFTDVVGSAYYVAPEVSSAPVLCMAGAATILWTLLQKHKQLVHATVASSLPGMSALQQQCLTACAELTIVPMHPCGVFVLTYAWNVCMYIP